MNREALMEQFFTALISGARDEARAVVDRLLDADLQAEQIVAHLFWPTLEHIQKLHRADQLSELGHHYATRLMRMLADQMQLRLTRHAPNGRSAVVVCGPHEPEELSAQIMTDLLEAAGFQTYFLGGGVANDEIVAQLGELSADVLVVFGVDPQTVPYTRLLIDELRNIGMCPDLQIAVGGGVFNRAEGLAEEIGADVWETSPANLVQLLVDEPERRMVAEQQTVGRRRRGGKRRAA